MPIDTFALPRGRDRRPGLVDERIPSSGYPATLPNLAGWWRADTITGLNNGDTLQTWLDQSGNSKDFTNTGASSTYPVYKTGRVNGYPALSFDGTDDGLSNTLIVANPFTVCVVYAWMGIGPNPERVMNGSNNWLIGPRRDVGPGYGAYNGAFMLGPGMTSGAWVYVTFTQSATGAVLRHNGVQVATNASTTPPGTLYMAKAGPNAEAAGSDVAECLVYSRVLGSTEITGVENYIKAKYGL